MAKFDDHVTAVGGLSNPSKMPTLSYSTPAQMCKLGALLQQKEGSTCFGCYALKGCYTFPSTVRAMARRFDRITAALASPISRADLRADFREILRIRFERTARLIARKGRPGADDGRYFRWHDSGDVQSVDHFRLLCEIAEDSPEVAFWLPTRETGMVAEYLNGGETLPPNLAVRLSIPMMDRAPSGVLARLVADHETITASAVHTEGNDAPAGFDDCPAYQNDGACGDCRSCWDPAALVSYPKH